jgi:type III secretion protein U
VSDQKTELPTQKRLRDAREKGQVCHSKDVSSAALLVAIAAVIGANWHATLTNLQEMILLPATLYAAPFEVARWGVFWGVLQRAVLVVLPIMVTLVVVGVVVNYVQTGPLLIFQPLKPDLSRINPGPKIKQMFSVKNLMEMIKTVLKTLILSYLLYFTIRSSIPALIKIPFSDIGGVLKLLTLLIYQLIILTAVAYVIIAAGDYFFQMQQYIKGLKMSKQEVKQEFKEMEGDPMIKSKRRQLHQELVNNDTIERVKKSNVLVTNPTHLAVAIYYDRDETKLPVVYAKGEDYMALRMIEAAKEAGVPIMRNIPLAHDLFDHGNVDEYIPSELIEPIAEVLLWVQRLKRERSEAL